MDWGNFFWNFVKKHSEQRKETDTKAPRATTAAEVIMEIFGLEQDTANWLVEALKQEGWEIKPVPGNL